MNNQPMNGHRTPVAVERCCNTFPKLAIGFLLLLIALALGLILGAVYSETLLPVLASIIAFAAALAAVVIALLIYYNCRHRS